MPWWALAKWTSARGKTSANPRCKSSNCCFSCGPEPSSAITQRIKLTLSDVGPLLVAGELSSVKVVASGHLYATLKDEGAVLSLVMWRSSVARMGRIPAEGARVVVRGSLDVYPPRGSYQLIVTRIAEAGQGDLAARLEQLKAALAAEGLFAEERKRPLPLLPRAVGLATAAGSAALADMLHSIRARFPAMPVVVAPCLVQGRGAAASIVAALTRLAAHPSVDVIVCGRGGGSLEDLWAFNERIVAEAIVRCPVPVVAAIGHETDTSLAELVADERAATPTQAEFDIAHLEPAQLAAGREEIDRSCRGPVLWYFGSAVAWLIVGSLFALLASLKMHHPWLLSKWAWLGFGRIRPVHLDIVAYGWAAMVGLGVLMWLMCRLCFVPLRNPRLMVATAIAWNIGAKVRMRFFPPHFICSSRSSLPKQPMYGKSPPSAVDIPAGGRV